MFYFYSLIAMGWSVIEDSGLFLVMVTCCFTCFNNALLFCKLCVFVFVLLYIFVSFLGVLCLALFCYALICVLSSFAIVLKRERAGCFAFIVFWMSCYCKCHVALPRGDMGWSAVCDCGIS